MKSYETYLLSYGLLRCLIISDNQDPIIHNCPSSITTVSRPGLNVTEVSWTPPKAADNSGPVEPIFLGPGTLGGNYSIGTVALTYMVEDMSGNMDICTFSITVRGMWMVYLTRSFMTHLSHQTAVCGILANMNLI